MPPLSARQRDAIRGGGAIIATGAFFNGLLPGAGIGGALALLASLMMKQKTLTRSFLAVMTGGGAVTAGAVQAVTVEQQVAESIAECEKAARPSTGHVERLEAKRQRENASPGR